MRATFFWWRWLSSSFFFHILFQTIWIYPPLVVGRFQRKSSIYSEISDIREISVYADQYGIPTHSIDYEIWTVFISLPPSSPYPLPPLSTSNYFIPKSFLADTTLNEGWFWSFLFGYPRNEKWQKSFPLSLLTVVPHLKIIKCGI